VVQFHGGLVVNKIEQQPNTALIRRPVLENAQDILHGTAGNTDAIMLFERLFPDDPVFLLKAPNGSHDLIFHWKRADALGQDFCHPLGPAHVCEARVRVKPAEQVPGEKGLLRHGGPRSSDAGHFHTRQIGAYAFLLNEMLRAQLFPWFALDDVPF